jgi:hypothetical protein
MSLNDPDYAMRRAISSYATASHLQARQNRNVVRLGENGPQGREHQDDCDERSRETEDVAREDTIIRRHHCDSGHVNPRIPQQAS